MTNLNTMKNRIYHFVIISLTLFCTACVQPSDQEYYDAEEEISGEEDEDWSLDDCGFEDGSYFATVNYYNPETDYSATYTLDVDVEDCQVVQINFPNDGFLDEDHISAAEIDNFGNAIVYGEGGKTYEIDL